MTTPADKIDAACVEIHRVLTDAANAISGIATALREAPTPAPYLPKVGDVVAFNGDTGQDLARIVTRLDAGSARVAYVSRDHTDEVVASFTNLTNDSLTYLRPATPAERVSAGIDAAPVAPVARPEWVRCVSCDGSWFIPGKAYRVSRWDDEGVPHVTDEWGVPAMFGSSKWEPCAPPPASFKAVPREDTVGVTIYGLPSEGDTVTIQGRTFRFTEVAK